MANSPQGSSRLAPGTLLGGYRVGRLLGEGGMGAVYEATQLSLSRSVALKVLHPELCADPEARRRFVQEGVFAARARHPRLVGVFDVADVEGRLLLAYERVEGGTLRQRLDRDGALPFDQALEFAAGAAEGVASLHGIGILHRDLKPANLFLDPQRGVRVGDLGIAKDLLGAGVNTQRGTIVGTPHYMAPEIVRGERPTAAADVYALGAVLFECLAGRPPFDSTDVVTLLRQQLDGTIPSIDTLRGGLPRACGGFLERALAKAPADRFADGAAFLDAVGALRDGGSVPRPTGGATRRLLAPGRAASRPVVPVESGTAAPTRIRDSPPDPGAAPDGAPAVREGPPAGPLGLIGLAIAIALALGWAGRGSSPDRAANAPVAESFEPAGGRASRLASGPAAGQARPGPADRPPPAPRSKYPLFDAARRKIDAVNVAAGDLRAESERHIVTLDTRRLSDRLSEDVVSAFAGCEAGLTQRFADLERSDHEAALDAGEMMAAALGMAIVCRGHLMNLMKLRRSLVQPGGLVDTPLRDDRLLDALSERVAAAATRLDVAASGASRAAALPGWKGGLVCIRSLTVSATPTRQLQAFRNQLQALAESALLELTERPPIDSRRLAILLGIVLGVEFARVPAGPHRLIVNALTRPALAPGTGPGGLLARLWFSTQAAETSLRRGWMLPESRLDGERLLRAWSAARDQLLREWPYDLRKPRPARPTPLQREAIAFAAEADRYLGETRRSVATLCVRLGKPVPPEP